MSWRQRLFVLSVLALAVTVVTASGAFTTTNADRGTGVEVVEDGQILLGVDTKAPELSNGTNEDVVLMDVRNQFSAGTTLTRIEADVVEEDPDTGVNVLTGTVSSPFSLEPGESGEITVDIECPENTTATEAVRVAVTAAGADETVTLSRETEVTCTG